MADLVITAANVAAQPGAVIENGTAGAAVTAGQALYKASTGKWHPADVSASATAKAQGIALNSAPGADQPVSVQTDGEIDPGATAASGTVYAASATAGGIAPVADLLSTELVQVIGTGNANGNIDLNFPKSSITPPAIP